VDLKKALRRVAKVLPKGTGTESFQFIRFIAGPPSRVYATDGFRVVVVQVDGELPDVVLASELLVKAAKDKGEITVHQVGYGNIELRTASTVYKLQGYSGDQFATLPLPSIPDEFTEVSYWDEVAKAFYAAASPAVEPDLAVVRFTPDFVEATDSYRLVRVEAPGPWSGLVPTSVFKTWPKGLVEVAFTTQHAYFRIGEELRIVMLRSSAYPNTDGVIPKVHEGPRVLVPLAVLQNAVKQGLEVSELGLVSLAIEEGQVVVRAWCEGDVGKAYQAEVPVLHQWNWVAGSVLVNGKYLHQSLRVLDTPNVTLGYGEIADPLRVESGLYVACLWQMVY